jgi:biopolymer transport protein TolQ
VHESLSFWGLVANAGFVVQMVMLILLLASIVSWAMIVERFLYFKSTRALMDAFENEFWSGVDLSQLFKRHADADDISGSEVIFRAGFKEYSRLRQESGAEGDAVMQGCQRAMRVALSREEEKLDKHLPFLATVGSTSPYIGLFGTVWGIMNSFRSLANVQQATIATVAPGISEALIATAIGLFAAIPAVMAYNRYAAVSDTLLKRHETFSEEFSSILHRQAHTRR